MRNERAPRTLAECQFVTGYSGVQHRDGAHPAERVMLVLAVVVGVVLGAPALWHFVARLAA